MKKLVAAFTLFCFSFCFIPNQARAAVPLALLAPAALGAAVLVTSAATYYAPAAYQAGQSLATSAGQLGRKLYYTNNLINDIAGGYLYGKAVSAVGAIGDVIDYIKSLPSQFPIFNNAIDNSTLPGGIPIPVGSQTAPAIPVGSVLTMEQYKHLNSTTGCTSVTPQNYRITGSWMYGETYYASAYRAPALCAVGVYTLNNNPASGIQFITEVNIATGYIKRWYASAVVDAAPPTSWPGGGFDPALFATNLPASSATDAELDEIITANPGAFPVYDTPDLNLAAGGSAQPFTGLTSAELTAQLNQLKSDLAQNTADQIQALADANPTDITLQVEALNSQLAAQQEKINTAQQEEAAPDVPYTPAPLSSPYTLPEVDFGARLSQFFTALQTTPLFALPATIFGGLPTDAGTSVLSFDGGQYGQHSFDFADLAPLLLILRAILFTCFAYISVRIVVLKR